MRRIGTQRITTWRIATSIAPTSWRELEREIVLNNGAGTGYSLGLDVGMQSGRFMLDSQHHARRATGL